MARNISHAHHPSHQPIHNNVTTLVVSICIWMLTKPLKLLSALAGVNKVEHIGCLDVSVHVTASPPPPLEALVMSNQHKRRAGSAANNCGYSAWKCNLLSTALIAVVLVDHHHLQQNKVRFVLLPWQWDTNQYNLLPWANTLQGCVQLTLQPVQWQTIEHVL